MYGLDMRNLKSVEEFVEIIKEKFNHLEILSIFFPPFFLIG